MKSSSRFSCLFAHDLFGKPLHTFPDHALASVGARRGTRLAMALCALIGIAAVDCRALRLRRISQESPLQTRGRRRFGDRILRRLSVWSLPRNLTRRFTEKAVGPEGIADADDVVRRVVVEPERDVEIDLLGPVDVIERARIPELARALALRIIADIFGEQAELPGQFLLQHEGRFRDAS